MVLQNNSHHKHLKKLSAIKVMAHMYWNLASINGKERAGIYRDGIAKEMMPSQIEKAQALVRQKLNATANAFGAPDVLRTCHFATTIVNSVLAS
jgi:HD-like signal output (HDOD) protein